jgi:hypothetical protein
MGSFGELNDYGHAMKSQFLFDPKWTNLNHGGFYPPLRENMYSRCVTHDRIYVKRGVAYRSHCSLKPDADSVARIVWNVSTTRAQRLARIPEAYRSLPGQVPSLSIYRPSR